MARIAAILLLVSLSIAISDVAAYRPLTTTIVNKVVSAPAPAPVSYISSSPVASPTSAPAPGPSSDVDSYLSNGLEELESYLFLETIDSAIKDTRMFLSEVVYKQLYSKNTDESKKVCLDVCQQMYGNALLALNKGMDDVQKGDYLEFDVDRKTFTNNVHDCKECFGEKAPLEFDDFDTYANELNALWITHAAEPTN